MRAFTVGWNQKTDQTAVEFSPLYNDLHNTLKLDILKDAIAILNTEFEQKLAERKASNEQLS